MKEIPKWILENLCYHDSKNPNNNLTEPDEKDELEALIQVKGVDFASEGCYCDNCFYGRTKLAEFAISLIIE